LAQYRASLAAAESIEDFELAGANLLNIAAIHEQLGQLNEALAAVDRILAAPALYGPQAATGAAARKAFLHLDEGEPAAALRWADIAERNCASPCLPLAALENLRAHIALEQGRTEEAIVRASRAADLSTTPSTESELANARRLLGRAYTRANRFDDSAQSLASALALDRRLGLSARIALDLLYAGDNAARKNDKVLARQFYDRATAVSTAVADDQGVQAARLRLDALPK
jgi:tetratricopeptide (TPR) repeat protein